MPNRAPLSFRATYCRGPNLSVQCKNRPPPPRYPPTARREAIAAALARRPMTPPITARRPHTTSCLRRIYCTQSPAGCLSVTVCSGRRVSRFHTRTSSSPRCKTRPPTPSRTQPADNFQTELKWPGRIRLRRLRALPRLRRPHPHRPISRATDEPLPPHNQSNDISPMPLQSPLQWCRGAIWTM